MGMRYITSEYLVTLIDYEELKDPIDSSDNEGFEIIDLLRSLLNEYKGNPNQNFNILFD